MNYQTGLSSDFAHICAKTGERRIRLVESVPELEKWLEIHPKKNKSDTPLCWSQKGGALGRYGWSRILRKLAENAGIKKDVHPHLLRHSRATHLTQKGLNEPHLRKFFGWTRNSDTPSIYVHLSGRDTDKAILLMDCYAAATARAKDAKLVVGRDEHFQNLGLDLIKITD